MPELPLPAALHSSESRSRLGWLLLRVAVAGIIAAHGWARLWAGGVAPFGGFLEAQGFPLGYYWAAAITGIEIVGSVFLLLGRSAAAIALLFGFIYAVGIALVHSKAGWFVVGLGRNGSEFSVLLIVCLLAIALQHVRPKGVA
jgi:putative oxidoreductase